MVELFLLISKVWDRLAKYWDHKTARAPIKIYLSHIYHFVYGGGGERRVVIKTFIYFSFDNYFKDRPRSMTEQSSLYSRDIYSGHSPPPPPRGKELLRRKWKKLKNLEGKIGEKEIKGKKERGKRDKKRREREKKRGIVVKKGENILIMLTCLI